MQSKIWIVPAIGLVVSLSASVVAQEAVEEVRAEVEGPPSWTDAKPVPPPPPGSLKRYVVPRDQDSWGRHFQYPSLASSFLGEEGRTDMVVLIGTNGRVTACHIRWSSGFSNLDRKACQTMRRYARFVPARDAEGEMVVGTFSQSISWRAGSSDFRHRAFGWTYPKEASEAEIEGRVSIRFGVSKAGEVVSCAVTRTSGWAVLDRATCDNVRKMKGARSNKSVSGDDVRMVERTVSWEL